MQESNSAAHSKKPGTEDDPNANSRYRLDDYTAVPITDENRSNKPSQAAQLPPMEEEKKQRKPSASDAAPSLVHDK